MDGKQEPGLGGMAVGLWGSGKDVQFLERKVEKVRMI